MVNGMQVHLWRNAAFSPEQPDRRTDGDVSPGPMPIPTGR